MASARRVVVVGISGNGETTLGKRLAAKLDVPFAELDSLFHPDVNVVHLRSPGQVQRWLEAQ